MKLHWKLGCLVLALCMGLALAVESKALNGADQDNYENSEFFEPIGEVTPVEGDKEKETDTEDDESWTMGTQETQDGLWNRNLNKDAGLNGQAGKGFSLRSGAVVVEKEQVSERVSNKKWSSDRSPRKNPVSRQMGTNHISQSSVGLQNGGNSIKTKSIPKDSAVNGLVRNGMNSIKPFKRYISASSNSGSSGIKNTNVEHGESYEKGIGAKSYGVPPTSPNEIGNAHIEGTVYENGNYGRSGFGKASYGQSNYGNSNANYPDSNYGNYGYGNSGSSKNSGTGNANYDYSHYDDNANYGKSGFDKFNYDSTDFGNSKVDNFDFDFSDYDKSGFKDFGSNSKNFGKYDFGMSNNDMLNKFPPKDSSSNYEINHRSSSFPSKHNTPYSFPSNGHTPFTSNNPSHSAKNAGYSNSGYGSNDHGFPVSNNFGSSGNKISGFGSFDYKPFDSNYGDVGSDYGTSFQTVRQKNPSFGETTSNHGYPNSEYGTSTSDLSPPSTKYDSSYSNYGPSHSNKRYSSSSYGPPNSNYGSPNSNYGSPNSNYGHSRPNYGSSNSNKGHYGSSYGPANGNYGPPSSNFGSPTLRQGTSQTQYSGQSSYGATNSHYGSRSSQYGSHFPSQNQGAGAESHSNYGGMGNGAPFHSSPMAEKRSHNGGSDGPTFYSAFGNYDANYQDYDEDEDEDEDEVADPHSATKRDFEEEPLEPPTYHAPHPAQSYGNNFDYDDNYGSRDVNNYDQGYNRQQYGSSNNFYGEGNRHSGNSNQLNSNNFNNYGSGFRQPYSNGYHGKHSNQQEYGTSNGHGNGEYNNPDSDFAGGYNHRQHGNTMNLNMQNNGMSNHHLYGKVPMGQDHHFVTHNAHDDGDEDVDEDDLYSF